MQVTVEIVVCTRERKLVLTNPFHLKEYYKTYKFQIDDITVNAFAPFYSNKDQVEEICRLNYQLLHDLSKKGVIWQ